VLTKFKQISLVICLFLFLLVVVGGSLHLNPGGAFLAAATGTPLVIHVFKRWKHGSGAQDQRTHAEISSSSRRIVGVDPNDACGFEKNDAIRQ
jgi:hypothetical protein